jgi:hypothetical protein
VPTSWRISRRPHNVSATPRSYSEAGFGESPASEA